jgi:hypothetical protein
MSRPIAVRDQLSRQRVAFRSMMAALCAAWTTFTLKRAIADVASTAIRTIAISGWTRATF